MACVVLAGRTGPSRTGCARDVTAAYDKLKADPSRGGGGRRRQGATGPAHAKVDPLRADPHCIVFAPGPADQLEELFGYVCRRSSGSPPAVAERYCRRGGRHLRGAGSLFQCAACRAKTTARPARDAPQGATRSPMPSTKTRDRVGPAIFYGGPGPRSGATVRRLRWRRAASRRQARRRVRPQAGANPDGRHAAGQMPAQAGPARCQVISPSACASPRPASTAHGSGSRRGRCCPPAGSAAGDPGRCGPG